MSPRFPSPVAGRTRVLALALACSAAVAARAEEREAPTATPTPTPTSDVADAADAAEEIVVVGRLPRGQAKADPTAAATVVEAERFAGEAKGVAELIATAPGVAVSDYGGLGHLSTVSIRGAAADGVLVLLDGLPLNTAAGGGVDLSSIPRHWIDRIEVVRGPEGAAYGAGALGGVVNVVTRTPSRRRTGSAEVTGGSFDTYAAGAEGTLAAGRAGLFGAVSAESTGGTFPYLFDPQQSVEGNPLVPRWRRNDGVRRAGFVGKLSAQAGSARVDALAQLSAGRRELPGSPYALTPSDWQEDARALLSARAAVPGPLEGLVLAARGSLRLDRLEARISPGIVDQRGGAAGIELEGLLERGAALLRLAASADGETLRAVGLDRARTRGKLAVIASTDVFLGGRARLAPAVRAERVDDRRGLSTKLGASLRVAGPLSLRASGGRTFRAPSFTELYLTQGVVDANPALLSEVGSGVDASLVLDSRGGFASVGAHATLYRDLIFYDQATFGRLKPFNAAKALVRGLEVELATPPARALLGLSAAGAYTFLDTELLRGRPEVLGNELPHRARHRLFARVALAPGPATAHVEVHAVGRRFAESVNLRALPRTTAWNAGGSLRVARAPPVALHLEVKNLLDDRTVVDAVGNPLPSRTVFVTLRAGLAKEGSP